MSPAWIAVGMSAAGAIALLVMAPRASAEPEKPRQWAIERCHGDTCGLLETRYSGPTAYNLDAASERIGKQQKAGTRLVCIKEPKR